MISAIGTRGEIRTPDPEIRSLVLHPDRDGTAAGVLGLDAALLAPIPIVGDRVGEGGFQLADVLAGEM